MIADPDVCREAGLGLSQTPALAPGGYSVLLEIDY